MSKFKFINALDSIFVSFSIFLICFAWLEFYIRDIWLSLVISVFVAFCVIFLLKYLKDKKLTKKMFLIEQDKKVENYSINFQLYSDTKKLSLIKNFIKDKEVKLVAKHLEFIVNDIKTIVIQSFNCENFTKTNLLEILRSYETKCDKLIIFTNNIAKDCLSFAKNITNLKLILLDKVDFYNLCVKNNIKVEEKISLKTEKVSLKNIIKNFFSSTHFKGFFISGCILIFTSIIFPFTNYYLIFGTALIIISLICKLPRFKAPITDVFD